MWTPKENAPVELHFSGGAPAGTGAFHETGEGYPDTNAKFFARYAEGAELYLPGSATPNSPGVRAQVGLEGHGEAAVGAAIMRACEDPANNKWGFERSQAPKGQADMPAFNLLLLDFMAVEGVKGCSEIQAAYPPPDTKPTPPKPGKPRPSTPPPPPAPSGEEARLRERVAELLGQKEKAEKDQEELELAVGAFCEEVEITLRELLEKFPPEGNGGRYVQHSRKAVAEIRAEIKRVRGILNT